MNELFLVCLKQNSVEPTVIDEALHKRDLETEGVAITMSSDFTHHGYLGLAQCVRCRIERLPVFRRAGYRLRVRRKASNEDYEHTEGQMSHGVSRMGALSPW